MRMKVRIPKSSSNKRIKIESRYITVSASEYELMNFIGVCMFAKEKVNSSKKSIYK